MLTTESKGRVYTALAVLGTLALLGAATGISTQQTRTAAPVAVNLGGVAAVEGSSLAHARADHVHSLSGTLSIGTLSPPADDTVMTGNGSVWEAKTLTSCAGTNDVMRYQPAGNTWGCSSTMATTGESFVTFSGSPTLNVDRVLTDGTSTTIDTATANQIKVNVVSPVASASALASDPTACGGGQYVSDISAAGVLTCGTPAGTYTLPALTSTVLGGVKGTGAALVCSGTDKMTGFDAAGALQCGTDQTSAGGAYGTIQDEGSALTQRATLNFAGAGVSCVDDTTRTTCTIAGGGGGSPGGSTTQVQYNNAGAFGGMARVTTDGNDAIFTGVTTHPAAPSAAFTKGAAFQHHGSGGPALMQFVDGNSQMENHTFPFTLQQDMRWGCLLPGTWGATTITPTGSMNAGTATGTAALVAWASTDERTRGRWVQYPSATTASSSAGLRANLDYVWRGNAAGLGGWYVWGSFNIVTTTATQRVFVGLKDSVNVITATVNPSTVLDTVYFGMDNGADNNLDICSNDATGAATCTDLGANFPGRTANTAYDWALWAAPNGGSIGYYIRRLIGGQEATGTISTDLPRNTVALGWDYWINNGGTAAASTIQFGGVCYIGNP